MMQSNELQPAYVIHSRPYRETSALIDFVTRQSGRVTAIVRGVRSPKSSLKGLLQPFTQLLICCAGKNDLLYLKLAEPNGLCHSLAGKNCLSGLYLNELLMRLLERFYPLPNLFHAYQETLTQLTSAQNPEPHLRRFEIQLLRELGYGLELNSETHNDRPVEPEKYYIFTPNTGLTAVTNEMGNYKSSAYMLPPNIFQGKHLLALHNNQFDNESILHEAKRLMRLALQPLLGQKPLMSRKLFQSFS